VTGAAIPRHHQRQSQASRVCAVASSVIRSAKGFGR
jgi:hypothetical protein